MIACIYTDCDKFFEDVELFFDHLKTVHQYSKYEKFFRCPLDCLNSFTNYSAYKKHVRSHFSRLKDDHCNVQVSNIFQNSNHNFEGQFHHQNNVTEPEEMEIDFSSEIDNSENSNLNKISQRIVSFLTKFHSKGEVTKKLVEEIFNEIKFDIIEPILEEIKPLISDGKESICDDIMSIFKKFDTFYKIEKHLINQDCIRNCDEIVIDRYNAEGVKNGHPQIKEIKKSVYVAPIKFQLLKFLQLPGVFKILTENSNTISRKSEISHFLNGSIWCKIKESFNGKTVFPLFIYYDDFESGNALGSHGGDQSLAAFYYQIPTIPEHLISSCDFLFDALLFATELKSYGIETCVNPLIDLLIDLEKNGMKITIDNEEITVYFVTCLTMGDNLGIHTLHGFSKSFVANFFCRFCEMSLQDCRNTFEELSELIRVREKYENDVLLNEFSSTGINHASPFHKLGFFHVTENYTIDIMHDFFEGMCHFSMAKIILTLIDMKPQAYFSLEILNKRKKFFDYGPIFVGDCCKDISRDRLLNGRLNMSASEMKTFVHLFGLMVGDLVSRDDEIWNLYLQLLKINDFILKSSFSIHDLNELKSISKMYLESFYNFFGNLKPKQHHLIHYPRVIQSMGPPRYFWSFSGETKNRSLKQYGKVMPQRINLSKSFSYKTSFRFANFLLKFSKGLAKELQITKSRNISVSIFKDKPYFELISDLISEEKTDVEIALNVEYKKTFYKQSFIIIESSTEISEIQEIVIINDCGFLVTKKYDIEFFDNHTKSFVLGSITNNYKIIPLNNLKILPTTKHFLSNGKYAVRERIL